MNQGMQAWAEERRERRTPLELAVMALGAKYPVVVASQIGAGCRDVPAAVAALRRRAPHWFEPVAAANPSADEAVITLLVEEYPESLAVR